MKKILSILTLCSIITTPVFAYSNADIDRLTTLAVMYGRATACGANLDVQMRSTQNWLNRTFGAEAALYTMIFAQGLQDHAIRQKEGRTPDSCSTVLRNLK